jgi:membrane-associated phospholipid phosphatase
MKTGPLSLLAALLLTTGCATTRSVPAPLLPLPVPPSGPAGVSAPAELVSPNFSLFPQLKRSAAHLATAPLRWEGSDWTKFGLGVAAVGGALLLDKDLRQAVENNTGGALRRVAEGVAPFGAEYSFGALGAFYLAGRYLKDDTARAVAEDGLDSSLIAAGVVSPILKATIGRRRPSQTGEIFARGGGGVSFPSGHTTQAFAVASVVAAHYASPWIKVAAYGIAGLVGLSRMEQGAHYASDVLAGALIGIAVGNAVVRLHDSERLRVSVVPSASPRSRGVALSFRLDLGNR